MTDTVLGTDCSVWQDDNSTAQQINFPVMAAAGAKFTFIKASQGDWIDQDIVYNWASSKGHLLRSPFHYLDWSTDGATQARRLWNTIRHDPGELKPMVDYEHRTGAPTRDNALTYLKECCEELTQLAGRRNMLYTSPGFWADFGSPDPYWAQYDLFIAHWGAVTPIIPKPWAKAHFWQFTNKGDGKKFGAESLQIDLDYWMDTLDELYAYAGIPLNTTESRLAELETWAKEMAEIHNGFVKEQVQRNAYLQKTDTALATQYADANARLKVIEENIAEVENSLLEQTGVMEKLEARIAKLEAWKDTPL